MPPEHSPANATDVWHEFHAGFTARHDRLAAEYAAAWDDLRALLANVRELYQTLSPESDVPSTLEPLHRLWSEQAQTLLLEPAAEFQSRNPLARANSAVQDFDAGLDDLIRRLPASLSVTNAALLEMAGPGAARTWSARLRGWRPSASEEVRLRGIVRAWNAEQQLNRLMADGDMQLLIAQASVHLMAPWQAWRRQTLSSLSWSRPEANRFEAERQWWLRHARELEQHGARALAVCKTLAKETPVALSRALLRSAGRRERPESRHAVDQRRRSLSYWARQQRAVHSLLHLDLEMNRLAADATQEIGHSLDWLKEESTSLVAELESVIAWLKQPPGERTLASFPPPQASLISAEHRTRELTRLLGDCARLRLPATIELAEPRDALPPWYAPWRTIEPVRIFSGFLNSSGVPAARTGFTEAENGHQPIVREIERAREVVAFGVEEDRKQEGAPGIAEEAAGNALSLLEYQDQTRIDTVAAAERHLCQALAVTLLDTEVAVERSWLGVWAHLTRQSTARALREMAAFGLSGLRGLTRASARSLARLWDRLLVTVGWTAPPPAPRTPVENVLQLRTVLQVDLGSRDLPAIYNRLFRLAPVEDPRFLVGREAEMAGLAEAKTRWQSGAAVAVMVIGSRGSGKTSLLNCASTRVFNDVPVVSGHFEGRLVTATDMQQFLRGLLDIPPAKSVTDALTEGRRVILLEEFERTFLRRMGGFEALDEFLRILDASASNNLWVVSMNYTAFVYLSATTRVAECFSTRINAASVSPDALVQAVLQRHNLSGFRLHFEPPPHEKQQTSRWRRFLGLEPDRQQVFFDSLYEQSGGIFRSAFELWLDSIERVEGGVVYTRQPLDPDYRPLMRQLTMRDHFILQAVMQHGSLTAGEVALVLRIEQDQAQRRLRRMQDLEILEAEPKAPGLRVRPQASRFVREALYSKNLLAGGRP